jgi:NAD(P)-dependent dehydrogenase (short-subunit alcohol dehydrogenase family)
MDPRIAVVTGGGSGIGRATALQLAADGHRVVVLDRDLPGAEATISELAGATALECDVADSSAVDAAAARVRAAHGRVDVLVNNAGTVHPQPSHEISDGEWERLLAVHLGGTFRASRAFAPLLAQAEAATVVNVSSVCAHRGFPGRLSYDCAKAAIEALTRTLAVEWGRIGIRVNAVAPGFVLTPNSAALYRTGVADGERRTGLTALGRLGAPGEIADAICWLAGPRSSYVTGETIIVDGGFLVNGRTGPDPAEYAPDELRARLRGVAPPA